MIGRLLRWLLGGALAWQAIAGAIVLGQRTRDSVAAGCEERLTATTGERIARVLGDDAPLFGALRAAASAGEWAFCSALPATASPQEQLQRTTLLHQLRHALYPQPYLVLPPLAPPDPVAFAEHSLQPGQTVLLLVFDDGPTPSGPVPDGRPGWTCSQRTDRFSLWRFLKA